MRLFTYLVPGLPQFLRGQRLVGLIFGTSAVLLVVFMYMSNRDYLYLHRDLRDRAPRSMARELWAEKDAHKTRGLAAGLALVLLSALDAALGPRGRKGRAQTEKGSP